MAWLWRRDAGILHVLEAGFLKANCVFEKFKREFFYFTPQEAVLLRPILCKIVIS